MTIESMKPNYFNISLNPTTVYQEDSPQQSTCIFHCPNKYNITNMGCKQFIVYTT